MLLLCYIHFSSAARRSSTSCPHLGAARLTRSSLSRRDNRQSMHRATTFSDQMERRDMRRTTIFDDGAHSHGVDPSALSDMPAA